MGFEEISMTRSAMLEERPERDVRAL